MEGSPEDDQEDSDFSSSETSQPERSYAVLAALSLIIAAYTNLSISGHRLTQHHIKAMHVRPTCLLKHRKLYVAKYTPNQ